ncbi:amino acid ABC transporter substrate-binding protein, PAAT family [Pseudomonas asplenii]|uniref:Amino acid ABC transporter substrate-binding protein, PAAT family n=1 Tax=Pseudomonas asplenii TaxID=53407 RepID=A0A1H1T2A5_9PSED|nr:transporter substrate-binding domain-containing protein [Pseudomonas asplenii]SDS54278.1 amino acid ABC transporter substrate-binding protein, PAAT family [Pseudomonas asplenii]
MPVIVQILTTLLLTCLSLTVRGERLHIVTDPWAPYAYEESGQARGLDYETTAIVFQRLGIDVEWQFMPWKRCLAMIEQGQADGVLDIFHNSQRDDSLLYPDEALSEVEFVLFYAKAHPHPFNSLDDLRGLTVGVTPGYQYSPQFNESRLFKREPAPSQESNFGKLALGRVDLVITDRRVGHYTLHALNLQEQIAQYPTVISRNRQYLALRRNAGMDLLMQRFNAELKRFKREPAYTELLARYTGTYSAKKAR